MEVPTILMYYNEPITRDMPKDKLLKIIDDLSKMVELNRKGWGHSLRMHRLFTGRDTNERK